MILFRIYAAERPLRAAVNAALLALSIATAPQVAAQNSDLQDINRLLKSGQSQQALDRVNVYLTSKPKDAVGRFIRGLAQAELTRLNRYVEDALADNLDHSHQLGSSDDDLIDPSPSHGGSAPAGHS